MRLEAISRIVKEPHRALEFSDCEWSTFLSILRESGTMGTFQACSLRAGCLNEFPAVAQRHLNSMRYYSDRQALQVIFECKLISRLLADKEIKPVFLKGAAYTLMKTCNSEGRVYTDIDALVPVAAISEAREILEFNFWRSKEVSNYDERYYRKWAHELPPLWHLRRKTVVDLHHNILPPISGRAPDIHYLLEACTPTDHGMALQPHALFVHSAVHLFMNEDFRNGFRDLVDLYLLADEFGQEKFWADVATLAKAVRAEKEAFYAAVSLRQFFGINVDELIESPQIRTVNTTWPRVVAETVFARALKPHHKNYLSTADKLAIFSAYIRGHWLRMPVHILTMHLSVKLFFSVRDAIFGSHYFEKQDPLELPGRENVRQ